MGRTILVLLVLLVLGAGLTASLYPLLDCHDCPAETSCLRCNDRHRISWFESRRRIPLDPDLAVLLRARGSTAQYAGKLALKYGRPESKTMNWGDQTRMHYAEVWQVEGPNGPLVLAVLSPKVWSLDEGDPKRVILYDRRGRELDRCDVSMPGAHSAGYRIQGSVSDAGFAILPELRQHSRSLTPLRIEQGSRVTQLSTEVWPSDWRTKGVARIVARDGKLEVVAP